MNWIEIGRFLIMAAAVLFVIGVVFMAADKFNLGRLPGDIRMGKGGFRIYIPVTTCVLLSIVITLIYNLFSKK